MDLSRKAEVAGQGGTMVRLVVSREVLIDELFAYVVDPSPARARRLDSIVVPELSPLGGRPEPVRWASGSLRTSLRIVLEAMVMDGVRSRRDVAAFVDYLRILSTPHVVEVVE